MPLRRRLVALVSVLALGCPSRPHAPASDAALPPDLARTEAPSPDVVVGVPQDAAVDAADTAADAVAPMFRGERVEVVLREMATLPVESVESRYNHTHPVFRVRLAGGRQVAFRPAPVDRADLFRNDVAGYALARALGIDARVPPVTTRTVPMELLEDAERFHLLHVHGRRPHEAFGSVIYWMPHLLQADIFWGAVARRWPRWLSQDHPLPPDVPARAEELSTLMVFDALQGNTDRWHPGNLQLDEHRAVVYRDNSEAWRDGGRYEPFHLLHQCQRFSRALIAAVRRTDAEALRQRLAPEAAFGAPILDDHELRRYDERRQRVLRYIDRLVARYGEDAVFAWP